MIFLVAVTTVLPISVLTLLFSYQKARLKAKSGGSGKELTTSELQAMIDESVAEATLELDERVESLERQLRLLGPQTDDGKSTPSVGSKTLGGLTRE